MSQMLWEQRNLRIEGIKGETCVIVEVLVKTSTFPQMSEVQG